MKASLKKLLMFNNYYKKCKMSFIIDSFIFFINFHFPFAKLFI